MPRVASSRRPRPERVLALWDIDGTLLRSERAGMHAMLDALSQLHPGGSFSFDGIDLSGRLDPIIYGDLAAKHGLPMGDADHAAFRAAYTDQLRARLAANNTVHALAGVHTLVLALHEDAEWEQGLLTGNYAPSGMLKVIHGGFDPAHFRVNAFADDGRSRRDLPPIALQRFAELTGRVADPARVVIIGDTPHDIDCAHHHGCRCLAVATGVHGVEELTACGADRVVDDLSDVPDILAWFKA